MKAIRKLSGTFAAASVLYFLLVDIDDPSTFPIWLIAATLTLMYGVLTHD